MPFMPANQVFSAESKPPRSLLSMRAACTACKTCTQPYHRVYARAKSSAQACTTVCK